MEQSLKPEWMTASQSKQLFGIGFGRLMALANDGTVDRRSLPADNHGDVAYLFRVADVRNFIESADNGND